MKNKMLTITLIILVTITLIGVVVAVLLWQFQKDDGANAEEKVPTIDEIIESTIEIPEITTNLSSKQFIKLTLTVQTTSLKAAEELAKREFQVKNIVIQELSEITAQDLEGKVGKQNFEESLKSLINPLMLEGEVEKVYIVSYIIQ